MSDQQGPEATATLSPAPCGLTGDLKVCCPSWCWARGPLAAPPTPVPAPGTSGHAPHPSPGQGDLNLHPLPNRACQGWDRLGLHLA